MKKQKVFCVGWHKTGTTTLGDALLLLGYKVSGARLDLADPLLAGDKNSALAVASQFEALQDVPWNALYRELDVQFPGSKFILTVRDESNWLNSASAHFKAEYSRMREWLYGYGVLEGNESVFLNRYNRHNRDVLEYFKNRSGDLLVMDLAKGDGWDKLCPFLGLAIPTTKFPHSNKGKHSRTSADRMRDFIRQITPLWLRNIRLSFLRGIGAKDPRNRFHNREQNQMERSKSLNTPTKNHEV